MKSLIEYIKESLQKNEECDAFVKSFKDNMFYASELADAIEYVCKESNIKYEHIQFVCYVPTRGMSPNIYPVKYKWNDNEVLGFEKFNSNTIDLFNKKIINKFIEELRNAKNDIIQISLPELHGNICCTINPDEISNCLKIIFSYSKYPVYYNSEDKYEIRN